MKPKKAVTCEAQDQYRCGYQSNETDVILLLLLFMSVASANKHENANDFERWNLDVKTIFEINLKEILIVFFSRKCFERNQKSLLNHENWQENEFSKNFSSNFRPFFS